MNKMSIATESKSAILASSAFGEAIPGVAQYIMDKAYSRCGIITYVDEDQIIELAERDIAEVGRRLCEYVDDKGVSDIVFLDRSARPGYVVFKETWKHMHGDKTMPAIRFLNPLGLVSVSDIVMGIGDWDKIRIAQSKDESQALDISQVRTCEQIEAEIGEYLERYPFGDNVLLFDTCFHTGRSIIPVRNHLRKMGVRTCIGVVDNSTNETDIDPDFVALPEAPTLHCVAFGVDTTCVKGLSSIVVEANTDVHPDETKLNREALRIITHTGLDRLNV